MRLSEEASQLYSALSSSLPVAELDRNGSHIGVRCPYCGDSVKDPTHHHLNIKVDDPELFVWRCVRCSEGGIVNVDFLQDLNVFSRDAIQVAARNKVKAAEYVKKFSKANFNSKKNRFKNLDLSGQNLSRNPKVEYFQDRFKISSKELPRIIHEYKLIVDFRTVVKTNPFIKQTRNNNVVNELNANGIGFLNFQNSFINFRCINSRGWSWDKRRYHLYNLIGIDNIFLDKIYTVRTSFDISTVEANLVITEGSFDVLAVREFLLPTAGFDTIFIANNDKNFKKSIKFILSLGIIDFKVDIYSDSEIKIYHYTRLLKEYKFLKTKGIKVHYNKLAEDFGQPKDKIKVSSSILN